MYGDVLLINPSGPLADHFKKALKRDILFIFSQLSCAFGIEKCYTYTTHRLLYHRGKGNDGNGGIKKPL